MVNLCLGPVLGSAALQRVGSSSPSIPLPDGPLFGVNHGLSASSGAQTTDITAYETWVGRNLDFVQLHTGRADWSDYVTSIGYAAGIYSGVARDRHWSVPLFITGGSLSAAAAGDYDTYWQDAADAVLANAYLGTGPIFVRTGWEMNLSSQPWYCYGNEANYVAAWIRFVNIFRAVSNRFKFVWCPNFETFDGGNLVDVELVYPGDSYVDVISMDFYVYMGAGGFSGNPAGAISYYFGGNASTGRRLNWLVAFAAAHSKPVAIDEWGVSEDGFETFVAYAAAAMRDNGFLYSAWWEETSAYDSFLSDGSLGTTGTQFVLDYGPPVITSTDNASVFEGSALSWALSTSCPREVTWAITGGADASEFSLVGTTLSAPDTLAQANYVVELTLTDTYFGLTDTQTFTLTVAAPATLWTPLDLGSTLVRFFTAEDFVNDADGTAVATWTDHSASAQNATQGTGASQPTKQTRNTKPTVRFDGTDDFLSMASTSIPSGTSVSTIMVMGYHAATGNANRTVISIGNASAGQLREVGGSFSRVAQGSCNGSGNDHVSGISWISADKIVCWALNPANTSLESSIYVDGGSANTFNMTGTAINTAVTTAYVGQRVGSANRWFGDIYAVAVCNTILSDSDRQKFEGWAAWTFNRVDLLPGGHPYASAAPTV